MPLRTGASALISLSGRFARSNVSPEYPFCSRSGTAGASRGVGAKARQPFPRRSVGASQSVVHLTVLVGAAKAHGGCCAGVYGTPEPALSLGCWVHVSYEGSCGGCVADCCHQACLVPLLFQCQRSCAACCAGAPAALLASGCGWSSVCPDECGSPGTMFPTTWTTTPRVYDTLRHGVATRVLSDGT